MRRWVMCVIPLGIACGSPSNPSGDAAVVIDAPKLADAGCDPGCDPLATTPCTQANQRCTWLVSSVPPRNGTASCIAGGATPVGVACMRDGSGGDTCVKGATCYMGTCRQICDLGATAAVCGTQLTCKPTTFFLPCTGATPIAGLCVP